MVKITVVRFNNFDGFDAPCTITKEMSLKLWTNWELSGT